MYGHTVCRECVSFIQKWLSSKYTIVKKKSAKRVQICHVIFKTLGKWLMINLLQCQFISMCSNIQYCEKLFSKFNSYTIHWNVSLDTHSNKVLLTKVVWNIDKDLTTYHVRDSLSVHLTQVLIIDIWTGEIESNTKKYILLYMFITAEIDYRGVCSYPSAVSPVFSRWPKCVRQWYWQSFTPRSCMRATHASAKTC